MMNVAQGLIDTVQKSAARILHARGNVTLPLDAGPTDGRDRLTESRIVRSGRIPFPSSRIALEG